MSKKNPCKRYSARAEVPSGEFILAGVPDGRYRFAVGVQPLGWDCTEGDIIVSSSAPKTAQVDLVITPGR